MPHSILMNRLRWQWERFPYSPTENIGVFKTALTFVDSISEIWGPLLNGKSDFRSSYRLNSCIFFGISRKCRAGGAKACHQGSNFIGLDATEI